MHVNKFKPNILQDKQVGANAYVPLHTALDRQGRPVIVHITRRQAKSKRVYPYASKRQARYKAETRDRAALWHIIRMVGMAHRED